MSGITVEMERTYLARTLNELKSVVGMRIHGNASVRLALEEVEAITMHTEHREVREEALAALQKEAAKRTSPGRPARCSLARLQRHFNA